MTSLDRANEIAGKLAAEGISATTSPSAALPPCVLIAPPDRLYDLACGYSATWVLWALVPGIGNAEAWAALDAMTEAVAAVCDVRSVSLQSYALSPDNPPYPAYRIELQPEGVA